VAGGFRPQLATNTVIMFPQQKLKKKKNQDQNTCSKTFSIIIKYHEILFCIPKAEKPKANLMLWPT
jgi:hypothetical protein